MEHEDFEQRFFNQLEKRLDEFGKKIDALQKQMYMACGGLTVLIFLIKFIWKG